MRLWPAPLRTLRITQAMSGRLKVLIISGQQTSTVMISPGLRFVKRVLPTIDEINPVSRNTNIAAASDSHPIVFFDGVCGLCNHTVNWLLAHDPEHKLRFAPLQGMTAAEFVGEEIRNNLNTLVFVRHRKVFTRSAAVSRILMTLGGRWQVLGGLIWIIPWPIRDLGYRIISRLRYRMFGKHESCRLPTSHERAMFLD